MPTTVSDLTIDETEKRSVDLWIRRIHSAKVKWEPDYKRMKMNTRFAAGWQWAEQSELDDERYTANITLQMVKQKEATLYARNPTVTFKKRDRLVYQLWDGRLETLATAIMSAQQSMGQDMESMAIIQDYSAGLRLKELLDKVGKTLEVLYKWNCDEAEPDFKKQMKQLVRRAIICGVGYVKQEFERTTENDLLDTTQMNVSIMRRMKLAQFIMKQIADGEIQPDDERVYQLKGLLEGLANPQTQVYAEQDVTERLVFNFPKAWDIIPAEECTSIEDFINAPWVAEQYLMEMDDINAFFGTDIDGNSLTKLYNENGQETELKNFQLMPDGSWAGGKPRGLVYELWNKTDKTRAYLLDGWPGYLIEPTPVEPCTKHFWPWFTLTFNGIEACDDNETPVSPFPPSDVQQMKHPQKEWNRTRQELREHRKAKAPKTIVMKGLLTEGDKNNLQTAPSNAVIEVEGMPASGKLTDGIAPWPTQPIDPTVYDTRPLQEDTLMTTGLQEANIGPTPNGKDRETATGASIAEQSRVTKSSSNVDDLDGLLSDLALAGGQLLLQECSLQTVQKIVGPGAVWPEANKEDFVDLIFLDVEAASSGRPNKALEVQNWQQLGPILQQMGANPYWMVRETIKRLDDRMDPEGAFPLIPSQNVPPQSADGQTQGGQQGQGQMGQDQMGQGMMGNGQSQQDGAPMIHTQPMGQGLPMGQGAPSTVPQQQLIGNRVGYPVQGEPIPQ